MFDNSNSSIPTVQPNSLPYPTLQTQPKPNCVARHDEFVAEYVEELECALFSDPALKDYHAEYHRIYALLEEHLPDNLVGEIENFHMAIFYPLRKMAHRAYRHGIAVGISLAD